MITEDTYLIIPTIDKSGNKLTEEEAYNKYLSGEIEPINSFESLKAIPGFKPYQEKMEWAPDVAWPWESQFDPPWPPDPYD